MPRYQIRRPNNSVPFDCCFDALQEAVEIADVQSYFMEREYRIFNLESGKEEYRTSH